MESISYLELLEIHFIISAPTMIVGALITYFTVLNKRVKTGSAFWMLIIRFAISFFLSLWIWSLSLPIPFDIACFTTPAIIAELFCWYSKTFPRNTPSFFCIFYEEGTAAGKTYPHRGGRRG